jgi:hypothetical protein
MNDIVADPRDREDESDSHQNPVETSCQPAHPRPLSEQGHVSKGGLGARDNLTCGGGLPESGVFHRAARRPESIERPHLTERVRVLRDFRIKITRRERSEGLTVTCRKTPPAAARSSTRKKSRISVSRMKRALGMSEGGLHAGNSRRRMRAWGFARSKQSSPNVARRYPTAPMGLGNAVTRRP